MKILIHRQYSVEHIKILHNVGNSWPHRLTHEKVIMIVVTSERMKCFKVGPCELVYL
jgi:hypothetical protein